MRTGLTGIRELYTEFGNREVEAAAHIGRALDPYLTTMRFDYLAGQGETQARTAETPSQAAIDLVAAMEDFIELYIFDSDAVVLDADFDHHPVAYLNAHIDPILAAVGFRA